MTDQVLWPKVFNRKILSTSVALYVVAFGAFLIWRAVRTGQLPPFKELVPALSGLVIIGASWLAVWGQRINDQRRWERETRLRVYSATLEATDRMSRVKDDEERRKAAEDTWRLTAEMKLIGTLDVTRAAANLTAFAHLPYDFPERSKWETKFVNAARRDLGLEPLPQAIRAREGLPDDQRDE